MGGQLCVIFAQSAFRDVFRPNAQTKAEHFEHCCELIELNSGILPDLERPQASFRDARYVCDLRSLPDSGDQSPAYAGSVFFVTGQIAYEDALFVFDARDDDRNVEQEYRNSERRSQHERDGQKQDQRG